MAPVLMLNTAASFMTAPAIAETSTTARLAATQTSSTCHQGNLPRKDRRLFRRRLSSKPNAAKAVPTAKMPMEDIALATGEAKASPSVGKKTTETAAAANTAQVRITRTFQHMPTHRGILPRKVPLLLAPLSPADLGAGGAAGGIRRIVLYVYLAFRTITSIDQMRLHEHGRNPLIILHGTHTSVPSSRVKGSCACKRRSE